MNSDTIPKSRRLTLLQERFVALYVANPAAGAAKAAVAAGYAPGSARTRAYKLLHRHAGVQEAIRVRVSDWQGVSQELLSRAAYCAMRTLDPSTATTMGREQAKAGKFATDLARLAHRAGILDLRPKNPTDALNLEDYRQHLQEELNKVEDLLRWKNSQNSGDDTPATCVNSAPAAGTRTIPFQTLREAATSEATDARDEPGVDSLPDAQGPREALKGRSDIPGYTLREYPRAAPGQNLNKTRMGSWASDIPLTRPVR